MPRIGRYEIQEEIGRGAMGVVYLATDPRLRRRVAVKTYSLPGGIPGDRIREFRERFLREAQAAASLSHPGIVTIFDAGEDPALRLPFIAMEYVQGCSLKQILEKGDRLEPGWVTRIGDVLSEALHVAHQAGIVHRDVKPANILLRGPDGAAKIADFGVARLATSDLTRSGASLGSPAYMSPEQIRGDALDGRSDLFSLAAVLYEAFSGRRPFQGEDLASLAYSIAHETPIPIRRRVQGLPARMDDFFDRALAKDPGRRFPDGTAFRDAFRDAGRRRRGSSRPDGTVVDGIRGRVPARPKAAPPQAMAKEITPRALKRTGGRRSRFLGLGFAGAAILSILLIVAAWFLLGRPAHLRLDAQSSIEAGMLSLRVDGREVYSRRLSAPSAGGASGRISGPGHEIFRDTIQIPAGRHEVAAQVRAKGSRAPFQDSIVLVLKAGETRTLRMVAGRPSGASLSLEVD